MFVSSYVYIIEKKTKKTLQQQNCVTPLRKFKGQNPRLLKIPYDLFLITPGNSMLFFVNPWKIQLLLFLHYPWKFEFYIEHLSDYRFSLIIGLELL